MLTAEHRALFIEDAYRSLRRWLEQAAEEEEGDKRHELRTRIALLAGWWQDTERRL